ncbi:MAG: TonB family protein [Acidobacteriota bacterium]
MSSPKQSLRKLMFTSLAISVGFVSTVRVDAAQDVRPEPPRIIRKAGGVFQGSATRRVEPEYPPLAKAARITGSVVVEVTVDEDGNVFSARAISGHPLLKDVAVTAAKDWKFSPTMLSGVLVKVIGTITFNFNLVRKEQIEALKEKVNASPSSAELRYRLAELFREDAQQESAIVEYKQALSLEPDYVEAYKGLGDAYAATGRYDLAVDTFKQGLTVKAPPGFAERLNIVLGSAYLAQGRNEDALEAFRQAVAILPDSVEGHYNLGLTYLKIGDRQSAISEYTILTGLNEGRAEALRRLIDSNN